MENKTLKDLGQGGLGLYIHIPFCTYRCNYCDFLTFAKADRHIETYIKYLMKEIALYRDKDYVLDSIFIGGGTPSYINEKYIEAIFKALRESFNFSRDMEISLEINPETLTACKIKSYLASGINRFSLGVQTFDDKILKILGRGHKEADIYKAVKTLRDFGADNISLDMMLANPKQDMSVLDRDIEKLLALDVDHISYYSLILEEKTVFDYWLKKGKIDLFDDELERQMYHKVVSSLEASNFHQYEISNFAKKGKESRHNKKYWQLCDYLGLGLGAAGNIGLRRFKNYEKLIDYYSSLDEGKHPVMEVEKLSLLDREKEYIIMNMRLTEGFLIDDINERFSIDFIDKYGDVIKRHRERGLVKIVNGRFSFTAKGLDLANQFYSDII
ncbi:radical SAM family heme chaperone HemW [Peptoniphilaceae bacterium SGI.131]